MKRTILLMGIIISVYGLTSCLDNEDMDFVPKVAETNNSHYGKDGDSIPPEDDDSIPPPAPPTGGEEGHIPIKP